MLALLLSYQDPVDLLTGRRIDARRSLSWSNDKEFHHFFPHAFLRHQGTSPGQANAVANIVLLSSASNISISDAKPSTYLALIADTVGFAQLQARALASMIPSRALEAAMRDDYGTFLRERARYLHEAVLGLVGETEEVGDIKAPLAADEVHVSQADADELL